MGTKRIYVFAFQRACPKGDKEENELVMASLRTLYEQKQSNHQHSVTQKEVKLTHTPAATISLLLRIHIAFMNRHALCLCFGGYFLVKICEKAAPVSSETHPSSNQQKLGQLKNRAKRSLTESLEGIWKVERFFTFFVNLCNPPPICRVVTRPEPRQTLAQEVAVVLPLIQRAAASNSHV